MVLKYTFHGGNTCVDNNECGDDDGMSFGDNFEDCDVKHGAHQRYGNSKCFNIVGHYILTCQAGSIGDG